jgi:putative oxidoreductase
MMGNFNQIVVPLGSLACRIILAIIFFYAAIEKIADPGEFAGAIYNYQLLPDFAVNALAVILPWVEVIIAMCLVAGFYVRGAALISSALFLTFATALTISLIRGLDISCGCFGAASGNINWFYLGRDLSFLVMSIFVMIYDRGWRALFALRTAK